MNCKCRTFSQLTLYCNRTAKGFRIHLNNGKTQPDTRKTVCHKLILLFKRLIHFPLEFFTHAASGIGNHCIPFKETVFTHNIFMQKRNLSARRCELDSITEQIEKYTV